MNNVNLMGIGLAFLLGGLIAFAATWTTQVQPRQARIDEASDALLQMETAAAVGTQHDLVGDPAILKRNLSRVRSTLNGD